MESQAGRQTDRWEVRQAGRQTDGKLGRQADRQMGSQAGRQTDRQTEKRVFPFIKRYMSWRKCVTFHGVHLIHRYGRKLFFHQSWCSVHLIHRSSNRQTLFFSLCHCVIVHMLQSSAVPRLTKQSSDIDWTFNQGAPTHTDRLAPPPPSPSWIHAHCNIHISHISQA